jgi:hypothetical protein
MSISFENYYSEEDISQLESIGCKVCKISNIPGLDGRTCNEITINADSSEYHKIVSKLNTSQNTSIGTNPIIKGFNIDKFICHTYFNDKDESEKNSRLKMCEFDVINCTLKYLSYSVSRNTWFVNCNMIGAYFNGCTLGKRSYFFQCDLSNSKFDKCILGYGYETIQFLHCNMINSEMELEQTYPERNCGSVLFRKSNMEGMDMRNCDFSNTTLSVDECKTSGIKVKGLKVRSLDSDRYFREQFITEGGIIGDASYADKITYEFYNNKFGLDL